MIHPTSFLPCNGDNIIKRISFRTRDSKIFNLGANSRLQTIFLMCDECCMSCTQFKSTVKSRERVMRHLPALSLRRDKAPKKRERRGRGFNLSLKQKETLSSASALIPVSDGESFCHRLKMKGTQSKGPGVRSDQWQVINAVS